MSNPKIYRAPWHDYKSRCIYMITLSKRAGIPPFAFVDGSELKMTSVGREVQKLIIHFNEVEPLIKILQYVVMPDHVHILLFVTGDVPEKLGYYIARWKIKVNKACGLESVFETGFNDQILHQNRSLKVIINYIRENPKRLIVRKLYPQYFRRVNELRIGARFFQAYGNLQLLDNPFKEQVVVHRHYTEEELQQKLAVWRYTAANGGVLVSPFISKAERDVLHEAESLDGNVILIVNAPMPERFKPQGASFERCMRGHLLVLALPEKIPLSRDGCLTLNRLASEIAG